MSKLLGKIRRRDGNVQVNLPERRDLGKFGGMMGMCR